jgi:D-alanyl-lipoteichoic acid acyltransferase DltB (MBOAT superfamily)
MEFFKHIFAFNQDSPLLFTQFYFWAFFALVYALFALIIQYGCHGEQSRKRMHLRNVYLMFVSWFFYYKTSGLFLLILLFVTCSDWLIAQQVYRNRERRNRAKAWLILSVVIDLGILVYFKYAYFFTNMVNDLFGASFRVFDIFAYVGNGFSESGLFKVDQIVLPVGISFFTFQVISYTADVFRGHIKPVKNLLDFGFYVAFFPQLVAGPIVRAADFIPQLYKPFYLGRRQFGLAVFWILNGLAKKIILSDFLAVNIIDRVFGHPLLFSGFENLFALFAYSLQVYADFSGYTDIAIGVAMLMGFYLPKNFNSPYKSQNPQEFWRRWHISLGSWLKSYLYIPLGGNRSMGAGTVIWMVIIGLVTLVLTGSWWGLIVIAVLAAVIVWATKRYPSHRKLLYANLNSFITQILGGLWHGASWNFVIWGGINGIGMIVNKFWRIMNWHLRYCLMTAGLLVLLVWHMIDPEPVINMFAVWTAIVWAGTLVRYVYFLLEEYGLLAKARAAVPAMEHLRSLPGYMATAWAVLQTFTFITFTRLFFRSGSNLDPATANKVAWETAKNMVNQIGGAWDNSIIAPFCHEYRTVVWAFVLGMIIHWLPAKWKQYYRLYFARMPLPLMVGVVVVTIVVIYQFVMAEAQPFIYFQF